MAAARHCPFRGPHETLARPHWRPLQRTVPESAGAHPPFHPVRATRPAGPVVQYIRSISSCRLVSDRAILMETASNMKPKLSILLPAMLGYETVLAALDSWETQTCRDQLEILILCPDHLDPTAAQALALPPGQVIVPVGSAGLHEARPTGIQKASS